MARLRSLAWRPCILVPQCQGPQGGMSGSRVALRGGPCSWPTTRGQRPKSEVRGHVSCPGGRGTQISAPQCVARVLGTGLIPSPSLDPPYPATVSHLMSQWTLQLSHREGSALPGAHPMLAAGLSLQLGQMDLSPLPLPHPLLVLGTLPPDPWPGMTTSPSTCSHCPASTLPSALPWMSNEVCGGSHSVTCLTPASPRPAPNLLLLGHLQPFHWACQHATLMASPHCLPGPRPAHCPLELQPPLLLCEDPSPTPS